MEEIKKMQLANVSVPQILDQVSRVLTQGDYQTVTLSLKSKADSNIQSNKQNMENTIIFRRQSSFYDTKRNTFNSSFSDSKSHFQKSNRITSSGFKPKEFENRRWTMTENFERFVNLADGILYKANILYESKDFELSLQTYLSVKVEQLDQQSKAYYSFGVGNCYFRLKKYRQAIQAFTKQDFPNQNTKQRGQRFNNIASCYAKLKKYELSLKYYNEAIRIYKSYQEIDCSNLLNNVGIIYMRVGMHKTAQKYFTQSIDERKRKSPNSVDLLCFSYIQLAICQKTDNRFEQAIENLLIALSWAERGEGDMESVLIQLAYCCEKINRWSLALEYYEKMSQITKNQGFVLERVSLIHKQMGHHTQFMKFIKQSFSEYKKELNERKISQLQNIMRVNGISQF